MGIGRRDETDGLEASGINHEAALAAAFGIIHRAVGRAQQFVGGVPVTRRRREADAGSDPGPPEQIRTAWRRLR